MSVAIQMENEAKMPVIKVIGVGGGGGNAVNNMIASDIRNVSFIVANTDCQALQQSTSPTKIILGDSGLGAGGNPQVGEEAATMSEEQIREALAGADMVFVAAGLGGGTGTGASPVVARIAKEMGALTVGVVTKPFDFEGRMRRNYADGGIEQLSKNVDSLITIPNERLMNVITKKTSMKEAFLIVDSVLTQAVLGLSDLITRPGSMNLDFKDIETIMKGRGDALMGYGTGEGEDRLQDAVQAAISSPLLEDISIEGAKAILINITGPEDLYFLEVNEAVKPITAAADENALVIFGTAIDNSLGDQVKVTVIATGFERKGQKATRVPTPKVVSIGSDRDKPAYQRKAAMQEQEKKTDRKIIPKPDLSFFGSSTSSLDIPTFLRQKLS